MNIIFAPHLDDEIIGCFSILRQIDKIVYFTYDYREGTIGHFPDWLKSLYVPGDTFDITTISETDTLYLPSRFDYHPFHKIIREKGLIQVKCNKMFYSIDMNVPWLEEEEAPNDKLEMLRELYPKEDLFEKNSKYWLFKSIKPYDEIIYKLYDFVLLKHPLVVYVQTFSEDEKFSLTQQQLEFHFNEGGGSLIHLHRVLTALFSRKIKIKYGGPDYGTEIE